MKVLIVDDEKPAREELQFLLRDYPRIERCDQVSDGTSALDYIRLHKPDLVFLDIQMPEITGIDVAEELLADTEGTPPAIIFTTAYDSYALKAFELHAQDYLLKPIEKDRLFKSLQRISRNSPSSRDTAAALSELTASLGEKRRREHITVMKDGRYTPLKYTEIKYASALGKITTLYTAKGRFEYKNGLHRLESALPIDFIRTHRSYIVNVKFIEGIDPGFNGTYQLTMQNEEERVPVSRSFTVNFREIMNMDL